MDTDDLSFGNDHTCKEIDSKCYTCGNKFCNQCLTDCSIDTCSREYCKGCTKVCGNCKGLFCDEHVDICNNCGDTFCYSCLNEITGSLNINISSTPYTIDGKLQESKKNDFENETFINNKRCIECHDKNMKEIYSVIYEVENSNIY